jgi:hypothetical protein
MPLYKKLITLADLKIAARSIIDNGDGGKFLGFICNKLSQEHGPAVAREVWNQSKCKFEDFLQSDMADKVNVNKFIADNVRLHLNYV